MNLYTIACLYNFAVIPFWLFTNISKLDPFVFSNKGICAILLFGIMYLAIPLYSKGRTITQSEYHALGDFKLLIMFEKLVYVSLWLYWLLTNNIFNVMGNSIVTGLFMALYGIGDFIFALMFLIDVIYPDENLEVFY